MRGSDEFAAGVQEGVEGVAGDDGVAEFGVADIGLEAQACAAVEAGGGGYGEGGVVGGAGVEAQRGLDDGEEDASCFPLGIGEAMGASELGASDFEPVEGMGVEVGAHLIGFGIADAEVVGVTQG